jgi:DNA-binding transcriptional LysR family regulator
MLAAVRTGRADLGVGVLDVHPADLDSTLLATYPQVAALPADHRLARNSALTLADLTDTALVIPPPDRPHRVALERALQAANVNWSVAVEAEGWPLMLHFAGLGVGLAIVNGCVRMPAGVVSRPIIDLPRVSYHAVRLPAQQDDARVSELITAITSQLSRRDRAAD